MQSSDSEIEMTHAGVGNYLPPVSLLAAQKKLETQLPCRYSICKINPVVQH